MRLNTNQGLEKSTGNELHASPALAVREITEDEIVKRIVEKTGPGSLMDDLAKFPLHEERLERIRLR